MVGRRGVLLTIKLCRMHYRIREENDDPTGVDQGFSARGRRVAGTELFRPRLGHDRRRRLVAEAPLIFPLSKSLLPLN